MFFIVNICIELAVVFALFAIYSSLDNISRTLQRLLPPEAVEAAPHHAEDAAE